MHNNLLFCRSKKYNYKKADDYEKSQKVKLQSQSVDVCWFFLQIGKESHCSLGLTPTHGRG